MSDERKGIRIKLSPGRKMVIEMMHHARKVPSIPVARSCNLSAVAAARQETSRAPSWTCLFIRSYALVARDYHDLRRSYIPFPYPHLYEHPHSVCALVVERDWHGEATLVAAKIRAPEDMSLPTIVEHMRRFREDPVWELSDFRQLLRLGTLPWFCRRFAIWQSLYLSGFKRAKRLGTYMVSSYGSQGAEQLHPLSPLSTLLTFGPIGPTGDVVVKVIYDHRVMDGRRVAQALADVERVMNHDMVAELCALQRRVA
jgi:hypothetical protein